MAGRIVKGTRGSPLGRGDLATSLVLIFPLFLAYEIGVMFSPSLNGVDFVTRTVYAAVGEDRYRYLVVHVALAVIYLGYLLYLRRRRTFSFDVIVPVVVESAIYALTLGTLIILVMQHVLGFDDALTAIAGVPGWLAHTIDDLALGKTGQSVVTSLGAGVHEELVFRLGIMAGTAMLLSRMGITHVLAVVIGLGISAALFSAAHHVGPRGDAFELGVFTYRLLAGVAFGLIFYFRSLAHAVYTHFLYDVYVLVIRS